MKIQTLFKAIPMYVFGGLYVAAVWVAAQLDTAYRWARDVGRRAKTWTVAQYQAVVNWFASINQGS